MSGITEQELREFCLEHFNYDEDTGIVTLKKHRGRGERFKVGEQIGTKEPKDGYLVVKVKCKAYKIHRLIWLMKTGSFPESVIDHIDGINTNNSWNNLQAVTNQQNLRNSKRATTNKSGTTGVYWDGRGRGRWGARITSDYKNVYLGTFDTYEEAVKARKEAETYLGYHKNHGRIFAS